jgi:CRP/FNR family cyclic AMP-dependent transcriptional regulator
VNGRAPIAVAKPTLPEPGGERRAAALRPVSGFTPKRFGGEVAPVRLLEVDPDLARGVPTEQAMHARRHSLARAIGLDRRRWHSTEISSAATPAWLGLYVLSGLLVRRTRVGSRDTGELLGPGDVFRPWDEDHGYEPLSVETDWLVLSPARLAVLDHHFVARMAPWPAVGAALAGHLSDRVRQQAALQAISHLPRADTRLLLTFWILADRLGTVRPDGVVVRLPLTHSVLATLIGSHRPTVTIALRTLADDGLLRRTSRDEWLMTSAAVEAIAPVRGVPTAPRRVRPRGTAAPL